MFTVSQIRCSRTGYYQNPRDCTRFVACLFDPNTRSKVLHLMRCPSGLVWDNEHKLCMESSSTCSDEMDLRGAVPESDEYLRLFSDITSNEGSSAPTADSKRDDLINAKVKYIDNELNG